MKEIIELLAGCNEFIEENPSEYGLELPVNDVKIIVATLEKQVAMKPIVINSGTNTCGDKYCANDLLRWYRYCPVCSQKIDWGNEE